MKTAARAVGLASCLVSLPALAAGLLYLASSMKLGLLLIGVGVIAMEGGVHLVRCANDPKVLAFSSPVVSGTISLLAFALAGYAASLAEKGSPQDEPGWLPWALYGGAGLCGWIGVRAGTLAISGSRKGPAA